MGNRKKLRRQFVSGEVKYENLSNEDRKYIDRYARRIERDMIGGEDVMPTFKEVPCQKWPGKKVLVPADALILEGEDGLLYLGDVSEENLIVSQNYKDRESARRRAESRRNREEEEKAVIEMKPTTLGEE